MDVYSPYQWSQALLLAIACCTCLVYMRRAVRLPLPPGPPPIPFLGNVIQMPKEREWITFAEWGRKYGTSPAFRLLRSVHIDPDFLPGDVVYASLLGRSFIILNSPEAINELLEKRSANYSDRPIQMLAGEMCVVAHCRFTFPSHLSFRVGYSSFMPLLRYGERYRQGRKIMTGALNPRQTPFTRQIVTQKAARFLSKLLCSPEDARLHIRWQVTDRAH